MWAQGADDFLASRLKALPEAVVEGTHNTEAGMLPLWEKSGRCVCVDVDVGQQTLIKRLTLCRRCEWLGLCRIQAAHCRVSQACRR